MKIQLDLKPETNQRLKMLMIAGKFKDLKEACVYIIEYNLADHVNKKAKEMHRDLAKRENKSRPQEIYSKDDVDSKKTKQKRREGK